MFLCSQVAVGMGQEKFRMATGIGFPELIHAGLFYQHKQMEIGLSPGFFPYADDFLGKISVFALSADMAYHFAGVSAYSPQRPWFVLCGLTHFDPEGSDHSLFLNLRLGRQFDLSARDGLCLSAGLHFQVYNDWNHRHPNDRTSKNATVIPGAGISYYFRLKTHNK